MKNIIIKIVWIILISTVVLGYALYTNLSIGIQLFDLSYLTIIMVTAIVYLLMTGQMRYFGQGFSGNYSDEEYGKVHSVYKQLFCLVLLVGGALFTISLIKSMDLVLEEAESLVYSKAAISFQPIFQSVYIILLLLPASAKMNK
ncbi:MAG: hypothetical protein II169_05420 [Lachnospiraceae bacterium]|nr:hypothetical protein [Lachnospiraceae bacterium]